MVAAGEQGGGMEGMEAPVKQEDAGPVQRSKKQPGSRRKGRGAAGAQEEVAITDKQAVFVRPVKVDTKKDAAIEDPSRVQLSKPGKATAAQLQLSEDRLTATGHKGYRTARCSHGVHQGTWYCEVTLKSMGATGHARVGWCTKKAEVQASVGFDAHGFGMRDVDGSKVHKGLREPYGTGFKEGDTVGMLLHLPPGGRPLEASDRNVVRYKGSLYFTDEPELKPEPLQGAMVVFSVNGTVQGPAFVDIPDGTYYPAASLFTRPEQTEGASVTFNFGPDFKFPPPQVEGCGVLCAMSERANVKEGAQEGAPDAAPAAPPQPPADGQAMHTA